MPDINISPSNQLTIDVQPTQIIQGDAEVKLLVNLDKLRMELRMFESVIVYRNTLGGSGLSILLGAVAAYQASVANTAWLPFWTFIIGGSSLAALASIVNTWKTRKIDAESVIESLKPKSPQQQQESAPN